MARNSALARFSPEHKDRPDSADERPAHIKPAHTVMLGSHSEEPDGSPQSQLVG